MNKLQTLNQIKFTKLRYAAASSRAGAVRQCTGQVGFTAAAGAGE